MTRTPQLWVKLGLIVLGASLTAAATEARAAALKLEFPNLANGQVIYAVQAAADAWDRRGKPAAGGALPVSGDRAGVVLDLPPGEYGVMAYLDRNLNGRLDTLPIGLPTEPYGFSNNSRGTFGPPAWRKARFTVPSSGAVQVIRLR